jgi:DNA-binding MarR family transcriptional regulator
MIRWGSMAYSEREVYRTLERLIAENGNERVISQAWIAEAGNVSLPTVKRGLRRLEHAGRIERTFTRGIGYRYKITEKENRLR